MSVRDTWQGKILAAAAGRMAIVVPSILAHTCSDFEMINLMVAIDPPCWDMCRMSLRLPFLCSAAKIGREGQITADCIDREVNYGAMRQRNKVLFVSLPDFQYELRRLADLCKLSDEDRRSLFSAAVKWLAADMRLDPTMDPRDPDAKRMTSPGIRPAHAVH